MGFSIGVHLPRWKLSGSEMVNSQAISMGGVRLQGLGVGSTAVFEVRGIAG